MNYLKIVTGKCFRTCYRVTKQTPDSCRHDWNALYSAKLSQLIILMSDQFKDLAYWSAYWFVTPRSFSARELKEQRPATETRAIFADARHKRLEIRRVSLIPCSFRILSRAYTSTTIRTHTTKPSAWHLCRDEQSRAHADLGLFRRARNRCRGNPVSLVDENAGGVESTAGALLETPLVANTLVDARPHAKHHPSNFM